MQRLGYDLMSPRSREAKSPANLCVGEASDSGKENLIFPVR
jgi:hypothetical protein